MYRYLYIYVYVSIYVYTHAYVWSCSGFQNNDGNLIEVHLEGVEGESLDEYGGDGRREARVRHHRDPRYRHHRPCSSIQSGRQSLTQFVILPVIMPVIVSECRSLSFDHSSRRLVLHTVFLSVRLSSILPVSQSLHQSNGKMVVTGAVKPACATTLIRGIGINVPAVILTVIFCPRGTPPREGPPTNPESVSRGIGITVPARPFISAVSHGATDQ